MSSVVQLTPLLASTPYLLAYVLPLLFLSLLLTFSGTFFTLDRSRSFPPANSASGGGNGYDFVPGSYMSEKPSKRRFNWILEGGIGGLAGGYVFGGDSSLIFSRSFAYDLDSSFCDRTRIIDSSDDKYYSLVAEILFSHMGFVLYHDDPVCRPLPLRCISVFRHFRRVRAPPSTTTFKLLTSVTVP